MHSHISLDPRRSARMLIVTVLSLLIALLIVHLPPPAAAAGPDEDVISADGECQDVVVIGARGSDEPARASERFVGPEVNSAYNSYKLLAAVDRGYRVGMYALRESDYPARAVPALVNDIVRNETGFLASIDSGVLATLRFLHSRRGCPEERYVLAGYSQGAMVMHRAFTALSTAPSPPARYPDEARGILQGTDRELLSRIDGVLLIADGDHVPGQAGAMYGTAKRNSLGVALLGARSGNSFLATTATDVTASPNKLVSVCMKDDIVCDVVPSVGLIAMAVAGPGVVLKAVATARLATPVGIHTGSYKVGGAAQHDLAAASEAVADRLPLRVEPHDTGRVGQPYQFSPLASGGSAPYTYTVTTDAPGVTSDGAALSGTPTEQGDWTITVTARDATGRQGSGTGRLLIFGPESPATTTPPPPPPQSTTGLNHASAISCATPASCLAASGLPFTSTWNGTAWATPAAAPLLWHRFADGFSDPTKLECPAAGVCYLGSLDGLYTTGDGGRSWIATLPGPVRAVSCASEDWCVAVSTGDDGVRTFVGSGSTWVAAGGMVAAEGLPVQMQCPGVGRCFSANTDGSVTVFDGSTWSTVAADVGSSHEYPFAFTALACSSASSCFAFPQSGGLAAFDAETWSAGPLPDGLTGQRVQAFDCATTVCVAVDVVGDTSVWDGTQWADGGRIVGRVHDDDYPAALSCPTNELCLLLFGAGDVAAWRPDAGWRLDEAVQPQMAGEPPGYD